MKIVIYGPSLSNCAPVERAIEDVVKVDEVRYLQEENNGEGLKEVLDGRNGDDYEAVIFIKVAPPREIELAQRNGLKVLLLVDEGIEYTGVHIGVTRDFSDKEVIKEHIVNFFSGETIDLPPVSNAG